MNKIFEFAAKAALEDYINQDAEDCIGYEKIEKAAKEFNAYIESIQLADEVRRDLDDKITFLITKYEDCAFINGFCTAAELANGQS